MNSKQVIFTLLLIHICSTNRQFPEDFSSIDQLTYFDETSSEEEIYIGSYYHSLDPTLSDIIDDKHNGIKIYPKKLSNVNVGPCSYTAPPTINDDYFWSTTDYDKAYSPPTYGLISDCINDNNEIILDLSSILETPPSYISSYNIYVWIQVSSTINIVCNAGGTSVTITTDNGLYQIYIKYSKNKFNIDNTDFPCESKEIKISSSTSISFQKLKLSAVISKDKVSKIICADNSACPLSYYCNIDSKECKKCLGKFARCKSRDLGITCNRFTEEWDNSDSEQESCNAQYFNLKNLDEMTFDISPPIKSNAASISFWLFTNENDDDDDENLYHITLEDFFVVTIIPGKDKYFIYVIGYEMYHEAYETVIKDINKKSEFMNFIENTFPYKKWYKKQEISIKNRWINVIVSYNKNLRRLNMQIFYQKRANTGGPDIEDYNTDDDSLPGEYIYYREADQNDIPQSTLRFNKFYRNSDITHLNMKIYSNDNNKGMYIRKLYAFVTELLIKDSLNSFKDIFGFQYIEFEKIFKIDNHLMPELVLAVPFDNIIPSTDKSQYSIEYFLYDMSKIYNNRNKKYLVISPGNIEESLYKYAPSLYRLNLITESNKKYDNPLLETSDFTCTDTTKIENCYYNELNSNSFPYTCKGSYLIEPESRMCISFNDITSGKILVRGINANNNGKGTLNEVCYLGNCQKGELTEFGCGLSEQKLFDGCILSSDNYLGYFYYSYFFNLPPIKLDLGSTYYEYYIQFNFLYETNIKLHPKNKMKGKKLYLFYTDAFKIWHDHTMSYLVIEDRLGNPSKNLIPNFNVQNENTFTISVRKEDGIYKGKVFLNGIKIHMPSFTGSTLSYILFCHNDTACSAGKNIFWTSGFYNQIKIYDLSGIKVLNDNSFYDLYIYNDYYNYYYYIKGKPRFNSYPSEKSFDMEINTMGYNIICSQTISSPYTNTDKLQMFNYGIDQTLYLRNKGTANPNYKYINNNYEEELCPNSLSCYGNNDIFSNEVKTCDNLKYYKYDTCNDFPTSLKKKYYSLTLPLKEGFSSTTEIIYNSLDLDMKVDDTNKIYGRKVTYTFWIKLMGFKDPNNIFHFGENSKDFCYLNYEKFNKLSLICISSGSSIIYKNSYTIDRKDFGKYMHVNIALSIHIHNSAHKYFISFQVNNENINNLNTNSFDSTGLSFLVDITMFTLYTQIYAQISKFYIYNEVLIGGYAFNTNKYFNLSPKAIVDETNENCLPEQTSYTCIQDYDPVLNNDYYINSGYPGDLNVFLTQNNMYKIKECSDECATSCYNTGDDQCACATNSFYDYIIEKSGSYFCKKLPFLNFKRYDSEKIEFHSPPPAVGLDFWFYATEGVNDYSSSTNLFTIKVSDSPTNHYDINIKKNEVEYPVICEDPISITSDIFDKWKHIACQFSSSININSIEFINDESRLTSPGIMIIRQFKIWKQYPDDENEVEKLYNTAFETNLNTEYFFYILDSSLEKKREITELDPNNYGEFSNGPQISYFGYSPVEEIKELKLCLETEDCSNILNLKELSDITFPDVAGSGTCRYTMEFWIKLKNLEYFLKGVNIIWDKHVSVSILTDTSKDKLSIICFPQDYLFSPYQKSGIEILTEAERALNKYIIDLDLGSYDNEWFYVRCAYNWDLERYYLRTNKENTAGDYKEVEHENASTGQKVDYPFKYFFDTYEKYNAYIQNANLNTGSEVIMRNLYLFNEYLPIEYDTQRVLFELNTVVRILVLFTDFFNFEVDGNNNINLNYYHKKHQVREFVKTTLEKISDNYVSKGGVVLCKAQINIAFDENNNLCKTFTSSKNSDTAKIWYNEKPLECNSDSYLRLSDLTCDSTCESGKNRSPGSILVLDDVNSSNDKTAICNYELDLYKSYNGPSNFDQNLVCTGEMVRVGFKCFEKDKQARSALYFNGCYSFYPVFTFFSTQIKSKTIKGYIVEFSFKLDLVNEFCSNKDREERYIFYIHPHGITLNEKNKFFYKDTNYFDVISTIQLEALSQYEWNNVVIEFNPDKLKINVYINYNTLSPALSLDVDSDKINNYNLDSLLFCDWGHLCNPLGEDKPIYWGAAYYSKIRIYNLKSSSVYMVFENNLNKFNYNLSSILVFYTLNTINNDFNRFKDTYSNLDLTFGENLGLQSIYKAYEEQILLFSSSSNFDYGDIYSNIYATKVELLTGEFLSDDCYKGCKRCYSNKKNDCYQCDTDYELFNNQCKEITGYYFQLVQYNNEELKVELDSDYLNKNPITITLWVKYYGLIRDATIINPLSYLDKTCALLIRFSAVENKDNIVICHDQDSSSLLMYRDKTSMFSSKDFLSDLGKWQLLSVSSYKCSFINENSCNHYPSMFSFAINGKVAERQNTNEIPTEGVTISQIRFGTGIIMKVADINIYETFILNPLGIIGNYMSYQEKLIKTIKFYSSNNPLECLEKGLLKSFTTGRDMYHQQSDLCIKDYNIYHDLNNFNCHSEDKMISITSVDNECLDCIDECEHCAGESPLNCACYHNDKYWFRNDKDTNRLYCQLVPYLDLNKYSDLQFNEIQYATTNEYAIEFWYFIYEYNEDDVHFYDQTISWENHVKIEFTKYSNGEVRIECFPLNEKDESISDTDFSQNFLHWNHLICATDLNHKLYYLNKNNVLNIIGEGVKNMNYSTYENQRVNLRFQSFNNMGDTSSSGVFLIKELKLWNFFSVREFNTKCYYNYDWSKENDIPNILHYFPFKMDKKGIISDVKGNLPSQISIKESIIGYNIIDEKNIREIDEEFEECLIIYALPQRLYYNLTNVLIYNYEIEKKEYPFYNYKYECYISEEGKYSYEDITLVELKGEDDNPREYLLKKFKDPKYNGKQLNIYLTLTEIEDTSLIHKGFTIVKINSYYPGLDIDFNTNGMQDNLYINIDDLESKYDFSETEIWNRLYLFQSLGDIHAMALNDKNRTTTFLNYYYDSKTLTNYPNNIVIKNPICNDNFCSGKGKCIIIVRSMICKCDEGYTGSNCHLTQSNKEYISETHYKMWNYLTNNNEYSTLTINKKFLAQITYLAKSSTIFDDSYNVLIQNFFNFLDYLKQNYFDLLIDQIQLIFDTISFIIINMYHDIQQFRAINFFSQNNPTYKVNENIPEVDLTQDQIDLVYDLSNKITTIIPELILYLVKKNEANDMQNYTAFDFTIQGVSHSYDYLEEFEMKYTNARDTYNSYLPYIDAYKCADYIFGSTSYNNLYLIMINYHYDPLSYHNQYSRSASYAVDIFFGTRIGEKLDIKACPNYIDIYFPLTLYNSSEIEFINSHSKFLGQNDENIKYSENDPYVTWPVYVSDDGCISKKSRYDRINEVLPMINIECNYYNSKQDLARRITSTSVSDNFYLVCETNHLSFYTIQSQTSKSTYKEANNFFYFKAPRVFKCSDNWGNGCSVLFIIIFCFFGFFIGLFAFFEKTLMLTKSSLNNIKLEILKQNRLILDENELVAEITKVNKMNEQDNMEKHLKIQTEEDNVDKDLKQNLYLYGSKNVDYNEFAFKGGQKGADLEGNYGGKGVFSNPPKKQKSKSKGKTKGKKEKSQLDNGFIIDDIFKFEELSDKEDDKSEREKETNIKKSIDYINKRNAEKKKKFKPKPKTTDEDDEEEPKNKKLRFYNVKEYNPEKDYEINRFNYNMYKDSDFGFNESEGSEENKNTNRIKISSDNNPLKASTDKLKPENKKEEEKKGENDENVNDNMHDEDDESNGVENVDYFSKYKKTIKNENKKGGKKVEIKNGNYTIVDKYRKVNFVKEKINYINIPDFYEQINKKDPNLLLFFWYLFLRRNIYISPFMVSSTINPRWKRILSLFMYIILQYFFLTFEMTFAEGSSLSKADKVFLFQLTNLFISDMVMLGLIPIYRISSNDKRMLFLNLKTTQQMRLLKAFKVVRDNQKRKLKFIIGIMSSFFIISFYFSFNYCSVMYDSRWTFAGCFLVSIVFDCFLYEGFLNGAIVLLFFLKKKNKFFNIPYRYLFDFRNYRNCF